MTLSIVARDPDTGQVGVAVHTGYLAVGQRVPWVEPGVGAVATQAITEASYGPRSLGLLRAGDDPEAALDVLLAGDPGSSSRQVGLVDSAGRVAAHTGTGCIASAGHAVGDGVVALANMAEPEGVWDVMLEVYASAPGNLPRRLWAAVAAGREAGGDLRGSTSAAVLTAGGDREQPRWARLVDLRTDDSDDPVAELGRLLDLHDLYEIVGSGINALTAGRPTEALDLLTEAVANGPESTQAGFWKAAALLASGDREAAEATLEAAVGGDAGWRLLWERLSETGFAPRDMA